jgi:hypothetical protein
LILIFQASVTHLIPLYAIGVFLSFTLSQAGMARRWWKIGRLTEGEVIQELGSTLKYERNWTVKMIINGFGAMCTVVVATVFAITKFKDGAWIVILLMPLLVGGFSAIHRHYKGLARQLSLENTPMPIRSSRHRVILPISGVHQGSLMALRYARYLSEDVTAVHISVDPGETTKLKSRWEEWGEDTRLVVLESPYRLMLEPLLAYIETILALREPNEFVTVVVPQFVPKRRIFNLLHTQTALLLRMALMFKKGLVIINVPYQVD